VASFNSLNPLRLPLGRYYAIGGDADRNRNRRIDQDAEIAGLYSSGDSDAKRAVIRAAADRAYQLLGYHTAFTHTEVRYVPLPGGLRIPVTEIKATRRNRFEPNDFLVTRESALATNSLAVHPGLARAIYLTGANSVNHKSILSTATGMRVGAFILESQ
jgi:hypothetical protein